MTVSMALYAYLFFININAININMITIIIPPLCDRIAREEYVRNARYYYKIVNYIRCTAK